MSCGTQKRTTTKTSTQEVIHKNRQANESKAKIDQKEYEVQATTDVAEVAVEEKEEELCAKNTKMPGYRIQIYFSKERDQWQATERSFRAKHPKMDVMLKYSPPHYRILVGQYLTKSAAKLDLIKLKKNYPDAVIANWNIWCKQAK